MKVVLGFSTFGGHISSTMHFPLRGLLSLCHVFTFLFWSIIPHYVLLRRINKATSLEPLELLIFLLGESFCLSAGTMRAVLIHPVSHSRPCSLNECSPGFLLLNCHLTYVHFDTGITVLSHSGCLQVMVMTAIVWTALQLSFKELLFCFTNYETDCTPLISAVRAVVCKSRSLWWLFSWWPCVWNKTGKWWAF